MYCINSKIWLKTFYQPCFILQTPFLSTTFIIVLPIVQVTLSNPWHSASETLWLKVIVDWYSLFFLVVVTAKYDVRFFSCNKNAYVIDLELIEIQLNMFYSLLDLWNIFFLLHCNRVKICVMLKLFVQIEENICRIDTWDTKRNWTLFFKYK